MTDNISEFKLLLKYPDPATGELVSNVVTVKRCFMSANMAVLKQYMKHCATIGSLLFRFMRKLKMRVIRIMPCQIVGTILNLRFAK